MLRCIFLRGGYRTSERSVPRKGLVTNYGEGGGATKREGEGGTKSFSHAEGGAQQVLG